MCKPGTKRCSGANNLTTQTCDENGAWVNGMVCPNLCSSGSCGGVCMPGTKRCGANNVQETCSPMGTWEPGMTCPFICSGTDCVGECKPGAKRCSALVPQECDLSARWQSMPACPEPLHPTAPAPATVPPARNAAAATPPKPAAPPAATCASETCPFVCQGSGVCGGQCVPGRRQCVGTTPQVCSTDGMWMNTTGNECLKAVGATCGGGSECMSGDCVDGVCCENACGGNVHVVSQQRPRRWRRTMSSRSLRLGPEQRMQPMAPAEPALATVAAHAELTPNGQSGPGCSGANRCSGDRPGPGVGVSERLLYGWRHTRLWLQRVRERSVSNNLS